jgi:hypothetical protein
MLESFAQVKTRPLTLEDFSRAVHLRAGAITNSITAIEREKLFACIDRFYGCYSSGDFEAFKQFRLRPPFTVSGGVASAVARLASQKGLALKSDEEIIHFAWDKFNGTNRIGEVGQQTLALSIATRQDVGRNLRQPSASSVRQPGLGAACWEGAVVYQPAPDELLKKEGSLRFFRLEVTVRFSPKTSGPGTPLVLMGYWDPTREDWMPYCLCTSFHIGGYDTIF